MSEPRWTPGPWQAVKSFDPDFSFAICAQPHPALRGFTHIIAGIRETDEAEAAEANARLIAAAPELLEQLNIASGWIGTEIINIGPCDHGVGICTCGDRAMLADIRAAIAKATGGAS